MQMKLTVCALGLISLGGCRPFDVPEYQEIQTSETGFLIPLEGNLGDQTTFDSEKYLDERKLATKRVRIPHVWKPTGRLPWQGEWIPIVRLIKVDRSPITREWTPDVKSGTNGRDEAIWIESRDSVGFSVGFSCTAHITAEDTSRFLYMYQSQSLAQMLDSEVRARIQEISADVAGEYDLDELRAKKNEMIERIRKEVIPFFQKRGVTITTIGMFHGFTYENPKIQQAIDEAFVAQQLKVVALAKFDAQQKLNEQIELEAKGLANKLKTQAEAQAEVIRQMAQATREAQQDPLFLTLKRLEVEEKRVEKWDGRYPTYYLGMDSENGMRPELVVQVPAVAPKSEQK